MQSIFRRQRRIESGLQSEGRKFNCRKMTKGRVSLRSGKFLGILFGKH